MIINSEKDKIYFKGKKDKEYITEIKKKNGKVEIYGGHQDEEYLTQVIYPCGTQNFYTGEKDQESISKTISNGITYKFKGKKDNESLRAVS